MLFMQDVAYAHPNREILFSDLNLVVNKHAKIALVGNNGTGKSTLLKILSGLLEPSSGKVNTDSKRYYVPQIFGQFNKLSVAQALCIDDKLSALKAILAGDVTEANLTLLDDDWAIEERCKEAFASWQLPDLDAQRNMETLSGGQKTKVFLAGIAIHDPDVVLLDEPSNHLDSSGRKILFDYVKSTTNTLVVVSHDRNLLNLLESVYELGNRGITTYGGNYDFYAEQKMLENDALVHDLKSREKALRKAKEIERESLERQQKLDARGRKKQEKAGLPTILMNTLKNNAEKSTSRMKGIHAEKVGLLAKELTQLRNTLTDSGKMKMDLDNSALHVGKILVSIIDANFFYEGHPLWQNSLSFQITSGERIVIEGANGSGKTTLIKMILGEIQPGTGVIEVADFKAVYIDQDYSLIDNELTVYEQAQKFNTGGLQEHEVKIRLNRYLFTKSFWNKPCQALSGGEKMRLMLCSMTISKFAPDMMILDEPTNNLDLQSIEILTVAIREYEGMLLVVSHDGYFLRQLNIHRSLVLE
jgi:ATPase subunit of ABC transporter with duplicated ATPase domains